MGCGKCKKMCGVMLLVVGLLWVVTDMHLVTLPIMGATWLGVLLVVMGGIKTFVKCPECEGCCAK